MPLSEMTAVRLDALSQSSFDPTDPTAIPVSIEGYGTRARDLTLAGCVLDLISRLPEGKVYRLSFSVTPQCSFNVAAAPTTACDCGRRRTRRAGQCMRFLRCTRDEADAIAMLVYRFGSVLPSPDQTAAFAEPRD